MSLSLLVEVVVCLFLTQPLQMDGLSLYSDGGDWRCPQVTRERDSELLRLSYLCVSKGRRPLHETSGSFRVSCCSGVD